MMQLGAMQDWKLRVTHLIDHAAREHGAREIVSRWADGSESRTNWAAIRHDAMRMAQRLGRIGIAPGERVATLAMNHSAFSFQEKSPTRSECPPCTNCVCDGREGRGVVWGV